MLNDKSPKKETIVFGTDNIVISKYIAGIPGGRTLDVTDFTENIIPAGIVIYRTNDGVYKPLAITPATEATGEGEDVVVATPATYAALPEGATYAGVLVDSLLKTDPTAAIMTHGVVNGEAIPCALPADFLPTITCVADEIA